MSANSSRRDSSLCCTAISPFIVMMASRAYEVLHWDLRVCKSTMCRKPQEQESLTMASPAVSTTNPIEDTSVTERRKSLVRGHYGTTSFFSQSLDDGEDSDAQFPTGDQREVKNRRQTRRGRRKVNTSLSLRQPRLVKSNPGKNQLESKLSVSSMSSVESVDEVNALEVEAEAVVSLEDTEIDLDEDEESLIFRERFRKLTRSLSIADHQKPKFTLTSSGRLRLNPATSTRPKEKDDDETVPDGDARENDPLFECIFIAGVYQNRESNSLVPFTRDQFPEKFPLPPGIEELCFPDFEHWLPHTPDRTRTYNIVLTNLNGQRTFGYCRRIQPEGDDLCLPLAMCILTRHIRSRGLFSQILCELTRLYGRSEIDLKRVYQSLRIKAFPPLGHSIEVHLKSKGQTPTIQQTYTAKSLARRPSLSQIISASSNYLFRQNSRKDSSESDTTQTTTTTIYKRKFKRPIDFRMDGAPICKLLSHRDILKLYSNILKEKKVVVISYSLSDLSTLFDGIESLLFPLTWQHTLIPALPATMRTFLEAPTPYLIGLLVSPKTSPPSNDGRVDDLNDEFWRSLMEDSRLLQDPDCFVVWISPSNQTSTLIVAKPHLDHSFSKSDKRKAVLGQSELISFPKAVLDFVERHSAKENAKEKSDEASKENFVELCETFLQMYTKIFSKLSDYLIKKDPWTSISDEEEQRNFSFFDYLESEVPQDYRQFSLELSEASLFEEYLRGRISALSIQVITGSANTIMVLVRKVASPTNLSDQTDLE